MKKKILYLFSDTGGGHRAAANALISAVKKTSGDTVEQEMVDVFIEGSGFLGFFAKMYGPLVIKAPFIWRFLWYGLNNYSRLNILEKIATPMIQKKIIEIFRKSSPDVIVSVHPLVNHLSLNALKKMGKKPPFITVAMDPVDLHKAWISKETDVIVVATEEAKDKCIKEGMPPEKIKVMGLPVRPEFAEKGDQVKIRQELGLKKELFTILVMGGGEGAGNIYDIVYELNRSDILMQLIVICGRNEGLKSKLEAIKFRFPVKVYGFTNEVPMIMSASDLIITKGGPGAIFEAMAEDLPMVITNWLPGQEEGNIRYVKEHNIGIVEKDAKKIAAAIKQVINNDKYGMMKENIRKIKKPHSVFDIADLIMSYIRD